MHFKQEKSKALSLARRQAYLMMISRSKTHQIRADNHVSKNEDPM